MDLVNHIQEQYKQNERKKEKIHLNFIRSKFLTVIVCILSTLSSVSTPTDAHYEKNVKIIALSNGRVTLYSQTVCSPCLIDHFFLRSAGIRVKNIFL